MCHKIISSLFSPLRGLNYLNYITFLYIIRKNDCEKSELNRCEIIASKFINVVKNLRNEKSAFEWKVKKENCFWFVTAFATLFTHLQTIHGNLDTRLAFLRDVVRELLRFKRRKLASQVEDYIKKVQAETKGVTVNHKTVHNNGAYRSTLT